MTIHCASFARALNAWLKGRLYIVHDEFFGAVAVECSVVEVTYSQAAKREWIIAQGPPLVARLLGGKTP